MDLNLSKLCEIVKDREAWHAAVHNLVTKQLMELSLKQNVNHPSNIFGATIIHFI